MILFGNKGNNHIIMGDFMMNFSGDDSVIQYLRQQKLMLLELSLLMRMMR